MELENYKNLTLDELNNLIGHLKDLYSSKFYETYTVVEICNYKGNISHKIQEETGFECNHSGKTGYVGYNRILIPKEKFTEKLKRELEDKYDNVA